MCHPTPLTQPAAATAGPGDAAGPGGRGAAGAGFAVPAVANKDSAHLAAAAELQSCRPQPLCNFKK